jgi:hypothetical protein
LRAGDRQKVRDRPRFATNALFLLPGRRIACVLPWGEG